MPQKSANFKVPNFNKFKFEESIFRKLSATNNSVEPPFPNCDLATSTPDKTETAAEIKRSFSDYCIGKTISFIDGGQGSPKQNSGTKPPNLLKPLMETTFTSEMDISEPVLMKSGPHQTPNDQLCMPFSKSDASTFENNCLNDKMAGSGDGGSDTEYTQTSSRISKVSFQRKYKPLRHADSTIQMKNKCNISKENEEKDTDNDFDKILNIMNSNKKKGPCNDSDNSELKEFGKAAKCSYYALFFMIISNLIGFVLSVTFQVLLFLKANADHFLRKSWTHWKNAGILQRENNLLTLGLLIPVVVIVCLAYAIIWTCFGINKFLLTAVPDRIAQIISFNFRVVSK